MESSRHGHVFRPGPFHRLRAYWLDGGVLHWRIGHETGHVALQDIKGIRFNLPEGGEAMTAHCRIEERSGRTHRISDRYWWRWTQEERHRFGKHERQTATFRGLTFTLARRLMKTNREAVIQTGPGRAEWIATCITAMIAAAMVPAGIVLMLFSGEFSLAALAFMALAILYLPLLWPVIRSGGPRPLDPESLHNADLPPDSADGQ